MSFCLLPDMPKFHDSLSPFPCLERKQPVEYFSHLPQEGEIRQYLLFIKNVLPAEGEPAHFLAFSYHPRLKGPSSYEKGLLCQPSKEMASPIADGFSQFTMCSR